MGFTYFNVNKRYSLAFFIEHTQSDIQYSQTEKTGFDIDINLKNFGFFRLMFVTIPLKYLHQHQLQ